MFEDLEKIFAAASLFILFSVFVLLPLAVWKIIDLVIWCFIRVI